MYAKKLAAKDWKLPYEQNNSASCISDLFGGNMAIRTASFIKNRLVSEMGMVDSHLSLLFLVCFNWSCNNIHAINGIFAFKCG